MRSRVSVISVARALKEGMTTETVGRGFLYGDEYPTVIIGAGPPS